MSFNYSPTNVSLAAKYLTESPYGAEHMHKGILGLLLTNNLDIIPSALQSYTSQAHHWSTCSYLERYPTKIQKYQHVKTINYAVVEPP